MEMRRFDFKYFIDFGIHQSSIFQLLHYMWAHGLVKAK
jgi:hypothetical protein